MASSKIKTQVKSLVQLGIAATSPIVSFLGRVVTTVINIDEDKDDKVEGSEILKAVQNVGFDAFAIFRGFDIETIKAEIADLDEMERKALVDVFAAEFDLENDVAEYLIEDWIEYLSRGAVLVGRTRKLTKKAA